VRPPRAARRLLAVGAILAQPHRRRAHRDALRRGGRGQGVGGGVAFAQAMLETSTCASAGRSTPQTTISAAWAPATPAPAGCASPTPRRASGPTSSTCGPTPPPPPTPPPGPAARRRAPRRRSAGRHGAAVGDDGQRRLGHRPRVRRQGAEDLAGAGRLEAAAREPCRRHRTPGGARQPHARGRRCLARWPAVGAAILLTAGGDACASDAATAVRWARVFSTIWRMRRGLSPGDPVREMRGPFPPGAQTRRPLVARDGHPRRGRPRRA
jgi:hypothetical protein